VILSGWLPAGAGPRHLALAIEEPAEHAGRLLKRQLEARGVTISGEAQVIHWQPPGAVDRATTQNAVLQSPAPLGTVPQVLASHTSVPIADAIRVVNKVSQNLHAEMLLRSAARENAHAVILDDALNFARDFYASIGIIKDDLVINDGSGLSRRDLVTPTAIVTLLRYVASQPWAVVYEASLPVSGQDGTLADRMKQTSAAGRIHAKTGSVEHVSALSGFAETLKGERLMFSIVGNNFGGRNQALLIDAVCVAMVEELGAIQKTQSKPKSKLKN
jgi:D-alanyl-D-alanine carboxypeptidase/D-alanyl-D-alanine-endopeptidase (penicillin-binding protein 4)